MHDAPDLRKADLCQKCKIKYAAKRNTVMVICLPKCTNIFAKM